MPRFPDLDGTTERLGGSYFASLAPRIAALKGEVYPLHVGDTWLEPAEGCRMEDLRTADHPGMHRYAPTGGRADLVEAIGQPKERLCTYCWDGAE